MFLSRLWERLGEGTVTIEAAPRTRKRHHRSSPFAMGEVLRNLPW